MVKTPSTSEARVSQTSESTDQLLEKLLRERDLLFELGRTVTVEQPLPQVLKIAAQTIQELLEASETAIFSQWPDPKQSRPFSVQCRESVGELSGSPEFQAAAEAAVRAALMNPKGSHQESSLGIRRQLKACAVMSGGRVSAVLVASRPWGGKFSAEDIRLLRAVGGHVAVALQSAQLAAERQGHASELLLLNEVAKACAEQGVDRLLPTITESICRSMGVGLTALIIADPERDEIFLGAASTTDGPLPGPVIRGRVDRLVAKVLNKRRSQAGKVQELHPERLRRLAEERGLEEVGISPLLVNDRVIGFLALARAQRPFSTQELRLLTAISSQVAVAVDNARLFGEVNRRAADLELVHTLGAGIARSLDTSQMLEDVFQSLSHSLDIDASRMYARRGNHFVAIGESGVNSDNPAALNLPLEDPVVKTARDALTPFVVFPSELPKPSRIFLSQIGVRRLAVVPLRTGQGFKPRIGQKLKSGYDELAGSECIGLMLVARRTPRGFTRQELEVLGVIGAQIAVALRNSELFTETQQRAEDLAAMLEAGRMLTEDLELSEALDEVSDRVTRMVGVRACLMWLLDTAGSKLVAAGASKEFRKELDNEEGFALPISDNSLAAKSIRERRVLSSPDAISDPQVHPLAKTDETKSVFALPLIARDRSVGVITLIDDRLGRRLEDHEIDRIMTVGNQVAIAIEASRLQTELQESYAELADTQAELLRRERLAALGELAALVAHEVRNPLGTVFNSMRSLAKRVPMTGDARTLFDIISEELDRLERIVGDLLDFARPPQPTMKPGALDRLISEAVFSAMEALRAKGVDLKELSIEQEVDPGLPDIPMDERLMRQVFINVVTNAIQAILSSERSAGKVRVVADLVDKSCQSFVRVMIEDNGPGIAPENQGRIFEPFFTTKAAGSGLGLAVVKRIVEGHRGEVWLVSEKGKGTRFTIDLPA